jgi:hypothetical protein
MDSNTKNSLFIMFSIVNDELKTSISNDSVPTFLSFESHGDGRQFGYFF